jgi:iron complex outermembrane recepter protein
MQKTLAVAVTCLGLGGLASADVAASQDFRVAQVDQGKDSSASTVATQSANSPGNSAAPSVALEEIVVTAQKREEHLQDVPIPVSVIRAEALTSSNQTKLTDYYNQVPGLSVAPGLISTQTLAIRGITTGAVASGPPDPAPTVGVVVDDVPFGGTGGGDQLVPDFDPGDLARIEVLRGPQGTLYGASSLGGLIKFVTVDPSTDSVSGRVEAGTNSVHNGAELGYTFRGSVNLPLTSDLAIRASAFARQDPGYIDDPVLGIRGVNEDHASGGHFVALWRPSDTSSLKVNALYQRIYSDGSSDVTPVPAAILGVPALGDLQQYYARGAVIDDAVAQAYDVIFKDKIGNVELTSLTGYNRYTTHDSEDETTPLGALTESIFPGFPGTPIRVDSNLNRFTEELRLAAPLGEKFDGLAGVFYSHEVDRWRFGPFMATDPMTGAFAPGGGADWGTLGANAAPTTYTEYAGFADLTYHITDRLDVQVGGRESQYKIAAKSALITGLVATDLFGCPTTSCSPVPDYTLKQNAFTYLVTPRFKISPDLMIYSRLASGFRVGGANAGVVGVPFAYKPDKTEDYEIGAKGDFYEHRLSVDASVYYIDWKDIQLPLLQPPTDISYTGNGGSAKSEGVELSVQAKPISSLTLSAWVAWSEAVLTESVPSIFANEGARLPNTPRVSGNFSLNEDFPIVGNIVGFVGGMVSYVGDREDIFSTQSPQRQYLPAYAKADLRTGIKYDTWTANFYVNNVADRRGIITGGIGNAIPTSFYLIQPRTIGLTFSKSF